VKDGEREKRREMTKTGQERVRDGENREREKKKRVADGEKEDSASLLYRT
jgi:hypothetical protein